MGIALTRSRATCALAIALAACSGVGGIDPNASISNDDTYATLGYLWAGARAAIEAKREPSTDTFNLQLTYQYPCARGGQGAYQGTLAGRKTGGTGNATLALTAALTACQFDDNVKITTITASGVTVSGTIGIANDAWAALSVQMVATSVTINGKTCPGGVDVMITGTTPFAQAVSTGTACGRTGAVALP
jgi:hypothetical protein